MTASLAQAAEFGMAEEARAMLENVVAAVKSDKAKALEAFNVGADGFKDRDLYPFCTNAADGIIVAHPALKGKQLRDIKDKNGFALGEVPIPAIAIGCSDALRSSVPGDRDRCGAG